MITILNGKEFAKEIRNKIKLDVDMLKNTFDFTPTLAVIQVGEDKASSTYVKNKSKACEEVGIKFEDYHVPEDYTREQLIELVNSLNEAENVHGILIQQPVPKHLQGVEQLITPIKDVDGFTLKNSGRLFTGDATGHLPCTAIGIIDLIRNYGISLDGKKVVVVGRSNIVGKPVAILSLINNATVTICHSRTRDLESVTKDADILIVAIGKPKFITSKHIGIKTGVIIDVGINRDENGKLCGDCDYDDIIQKWNYYDINYHMLYNGDRYITPVPGGVGPLTIAYLLKNTLNTAKEIRFISGN